MSTAPGDEPRQVVYFIGIVLPLSLRRQIADLEWQLYHTQTALLKPILPHITLLHPASLEGVSPSQLLPQVRTIAQRYLPMTIELSHIGFFGQQVCYLEAESFKLRSLQARLVRLLPPEARARHYRRPYLAHVTLAQVYDPKSLNPDELAYRINSSLTLPVRFTITSVENFTRILPRVYQSKSIT